MKRPFLLRLLCLLLVLCTIAPLAACQGGEGQTDTPTPGDPPAGDPPTDDPPVDDPTPDDEPASPIGTGVTGIPTGVADAYAPITLGDYEKGLEGLDLAEFAGGCRLDASAFPMLGREVSGEETLTPGRLINHLRGNSLQPTLYRLQETDGPVVLEGASGRTYQGNGAVILSNVPLIILGGRDVTLTDLTWINVGGGPAICMENTVPALLQGVEAVGESALHASAGTAALALSGCRLIATGDGLVLEGVESATVYDTAIAAGGVGIAAGGNDIYIENCLINSPDGGVAITADDSRLWYSTLRGTVRATGTTNLLLAQNTLYGRATSIDMREAYNSVALLNRATGVTVAESKSVYLAENRLAGDLISRENDYLLANGNRLTEGFSVRQTSTTHPSGDNLTDINARAEVGANEALLPQVDRDRFVGMPRKSHVRERAGSQRMAASYLQEETALADIVILAPGAYTQGAAIKLKGDRAGVTVYAYGVLLEKTSYGDNALYFDGTDHLTIKGLSTGHAVNSSGLGVVVAKREGKYIDLMPGAGMIRDWTDPNYYSFTGLTQTIYGYLPGHPEPYADMGTQGQSYDPATGLITLQVNASTYAMIEKGHTITCRGVGNSAMQTMQSDTLTLEDVTIFGAAGFAITDSQSVGDGLHLTRVLVTPAPAFIIDEETYTDYREAEERYGVSLGVYIDEQGRTRGTPMKMSTVDATHSGSCKKGITATSCLFESMCDDGTNQKSTHARMAGWEDLGNGTVRLYFKTNISAINYNMGRLNGGNCVLFQEGEMISLYRTDGRRVCTDTPALSDAKRERTQMNEFGSSETVYSVLMAKEAIDLSALEGVDLSRSHPLVPYVAVDNHSWASIDATFDNCKVQNVRSRGLLVQAPYCTIKHCSLVSTGMAGILVSHDVSWGESGMSFGVRLLFNYFENNGHYDDDIKNTPIRICTMTSAHEERYFLHHDFEIRGNRFVDRNTTYALAISGVDSILIEDNDFGTRKGVADDSAAPVRLEYVQSVAIYDNIFPAGCQTGEQRVHARYYKWLAGNDMEGYPEDVLLTGRVYAYANELPTWDEAGSVTHHGPWQIGHVDRTTGQGFSPYTVYDPNNGWISHGSTSIFGGQGKGGFWIGNNRGFAASAKSNVVIRFTAPTAGTYRVLAGSFSAPRGDGQHDGLFGIARGSEMVWPAPGDSYSSAGSYYPISTATTLQELEEALYMVEVTLQAGETLDFVARIKEGWSNFSILPTVVLLPEGNA